MNRLMNNFDLSKRTIYGWIGPRSIKTDRWWSFDDDICMDGYRCPRRPDNVSVWKVKKCWRSRQNMTLWIWFWLGPWKGKVNYYEFSLDLVLKFYSRLGQAFIKSSRPSQKSKSYFRRFPVIIVSLGFDFEQWTKIPLSNLSLIHCFLVWK